MWKHIKRPSRKQNSRSTDRHSGTLRRRNSVRRRVFGELLEDRRLLACDANVCVEVKFAESSTPSAQVSTLTLNRDYEAQVFIQDNRQNSPSGVFQAYFDVVYDTQLISLTQSGVTHGAQFPIRQLGDTSVDGRIDAAGGGSAGLPNPADGSFLLFSFPFRADAVGTLNLGLSQDASSTNRVEYFIPSGAVPASDIAFDGTSIMIAAPASPTVSIVNTTNANESGTAGVFTVRQSVSTTTPTVVSYTLGGQAASGTDFNALSGTVTIPANSTSATINVIPINDQLVEETESIIITLGSITSSAAGVSIDSSSNVASIDLLDNDSATVGIAKSRDGNEAGLVSGQFMVTQTAISSTDTVISYSVSGGTATQGTDFAALSGTVTIPAGSAMTLLNVPVLQDNHIEGSESLTVRLDSISSGDANIFVGSNNQATLNVIDDDTAILRVDAGNSGNEAGTVSGAFNLVQTKTSDVDTVVSYTIAGTAISGQDFTPRSGTATIPAGSTTASVVIPVLDDAIVESTETVTLTINSITSNSPGVSISTTQNSASINITDNDNATLSISPVRDGAEAGPVSGQFMVTQSAVSSTNTSVTFTLAGTATVGSDYASPSLTATIPAGQTSALINLSVLDDSIVEGNETVIVTLQSISGGDSEISISPTANQATIAITDNETPLVSIAATRSGQEQNTVAGQLTLSQSIATATQTQVAYTVTGTAAAGQDFSTLSGVATIPAGQTSTIIQVPVLNDSLVEGSETVIVTLSNIQGTSTLMIDNANRVATISIEDNDTATATISGSQNVTEADSNAIPLTVTLSKASSTATTLSYVVSGTATGNSDFDTLSGSVTVPANQSTATINVMLREDNLVESSESIIVTLNQVTAGNTGLITIGSSNQAATLNIADNDSATITIAADANGSEQGPTPGRFLVTQSATSSAPTVVNYTVGGTATSSQDFTPLSGSVTIPAGSTSAAISVPVLDDSDAEGSESVIVTLTSISNGNPGISLGGTNAATVLISDNESPQVGVSGTTNGSESNQTAGVFTLTQTVATDVDTVVSYTISGTASSGADFTALSGTAVIPMNATSTTISAAVLDDLIVEGSESLTLTITSLAGDSALVIDSANQSASISIDDDDTATARVAATQNGAENNNVNGSFTITLSSPSAQATTIAYTVSGSANAGVDYDSLSGVITLPAGATTGVISVIVNDDAVVEATENVRVTLNSVTSGLTDRITINPAGTTAAIQILDNDSATISIAAGRNGGEANTQSGRFDVTQSAVSATDTIIQYSVSGTATSGVDFSALSGSVTIPAGQTTASIDVSVLDDAIAEGAESVIVSLTAITAGDSDVTLSASSSATVLISDDDIPQVSVSATRNAPESGSVTGLFTVSQSVVTTTPTTVQYNVTGTASLDTDYIGLSGTAVIPAGQLSVDVSVTAINDSMIEGDETITLQITGVSGDAQLEIDAAQQTATIDLTDDESGLISIAATSNAAEAGEIPGLFTVTQDGVSDSDTTVTLTISGTATESEDFTAVSRTVLIPAGQTTATIEIPVIDDATVESTESVSVQLVAVTSSNDALALDTSADNASIDIVDNDTALIQVSLDNNGAEDSNSSGQFTITQSAVSSSDTLIGYTIGGTATSGDDYTALSGTVTIPSGSTSVTIPVPVVDDGIVEADETVLITLDQVVQSNGGITIDPQEDSLTLLIVDNDSATVSIELESDGSESGASPASFTVTQSAVSSVDTVIQLAVSGTATSGDDFQITSQSVTIPAGQTSASIVVSILDDELLESAETIIVTLDSITASDPDVSLDATMSSATATIVDDESGLISVAVTSNADESGLVNGVFTVTQDGVSAVDTVLNYTIGGTASQDIDFTALSGTVTIPAGQTSATVTVPVIQDDLIEGQETVLLTLTQTVSGDDRAQIDTSASAAEMILADDDTGVIRIVSAGNASEANTTAGTWTVSQSGVSTTDTVVSYTVAGTATSQSDFNALPGSVTIPAGQTSATITLQPLDDAVVEPTETVVLTLDSISSGSPLLSLSTTENQASVNITDNDNATVSISRLSDGLENGAVAATARITLSSASSTDTTVAISLGGTAGTQDFASIANTVTIPAGQTSVDLSLATVDDTSVEGIETVTVSLESISSGNDAIEIDTANRSASMSIADNDLATVEFVASSSNVLELAGSHSILVRLNVPGGGSLASPLTANVAVTGGSATTPGDFTLQTTSVTFAAGSTNGATQTVSINLVQDQVIEDAETIALGLSLANANSSISLGGASTHTVSLTDDPMDAEISGRVWIDANNDGIEQVGEMTVPGVVIQLVGATMLGEDVNLETTTDASGIYRFVGLSAGEYSITEIHPGNYLDGSESIGTIGGVSSGTVSSDRFTGIQLQPSQIGTNYSFGEIGLAAAQVNRFRVLARPRGGQTFGLPITSDNLTTTPTPVVSASSSSTVSAASSTNATPTQSPTDPSAANPISNFVASTAAATAAQSANVQYVNPPSSTPSSSQPLVRLSGTRLIITGSDQPNHIEIHPADVAFHQWSHRIVVNGETRFYDADMVDEVVLISGSDADSVVIADTTGNDVLTVKRDEVDFSSDSLQVQAIAYDFVRAISSSGGTDRILRDDELDALDYVLSTDGNWVL
ncbi:Calx-beta domain-containing protein [Stieleria varia]|uniref:Calx-beta domain protein n=1 Tax=Stieleria varia TaxID=2528005 RepID=A0A5C6ASQ8_9BACT|nr:Calx-beta domain-containing protein [Stieleria varia]TWU02568.1 Calx-beta domain protein [Stieleria varia]